MCLKNNEQFKSATFIQNDGIPIALRGLRCFYFQFDNFE